MAKVKQRHLRFFGGDTVDKMLSIKKSLVVYALLGHLFIICVTGHPMVNDGGGNENSNNNSSDIKISDNLKAETDSSVTGCVCEGVDSCEKNITSKDCPNGRVVARLDCACCFVCAKQLTENCNEKDAICDSEYGLTCGSDHKCQAKSACSDDTGCSNDLMCVGGACADPCKVLPDVCSEMKLRNGVCIVRNHRPICSCPPGQEINSDKECSVVQEEATHCEKDGLTHKIGDKFYKEACKTVCECEKSGSLSCRDVDGHPECKDDKIPLSKLGGELSSTCKLLIGHGKDFDGCCVPKECANGTVSQKDDNSAQENNNSSASAIDNQNDGVEKSLKGTTDLSKEGSSRTEPLSSSSDSSTSTKGTGSTDENSMQVMIVQRTENSALIDLPKSEKEAILNIALTNELNKAPSNAEIWKEHKIPMGLAQITLSNLIPNTSYTLKYSVNGKDSAAIQFITNEMQPTDNSTMPSTSSRGGGVGTATGRSMKIEDVTPTGSAVIEDSTEATSLPEMKPTTSNSTEKVSESEQSSEETLVIKSTTDSAEAASVNIDNKLEESDNKLSSELPSPSSTASSPQKGCLHNGTTYEVGHEILNGCDEKCICMENEELKCMERCTLPMFKKGSFSHDKMCFEEPSGVDECCVIIACARGNPTSGTARELIPIHPDPCDSVKCGNNAKCLGPSGMLGDDENQTNQTLCLCNESFVGDPYDEVHGCQESTTPPSTIAEESRPSSATILTDGPSSTTKPDGCIFNNQTFEFGDEHFDGCNYKCRCENSGEFTCLPRCNYRRDEDKEIPKDCEVQKDPSDSCCEMLVCHGKPLESGTRKDEPTTSDDGCAYKNKTYAKDEKFYDGCESQCMCISNGDVSCLPRCPPAGSHSGEHNCVTLQDPADKCCKVTICGNQTLYDEVMKAEAAKKSTENLLAKHAESEIESSAAAVDHDQTTTPATPGAAEQVHASSSEEMKGAGEKSQEDNEHVHHQNHDNTTSSEMPPTGPSSELQHEPDIQIVMIVPVNSTALMVSLSIDEEDLVSLKTEKVVIKYSQDLNMWKEESFLLKDLYMDDGTDIVHAIIGGLAPGKHYYVKVVIKEFESNVASGITKLHDTAVHPAMMNSEEFESNMEGHSGSMEHGGSDEEYEAKLDASSSSSSEGLPCKHKDTMYEAGQEFYDGCESYCICDGKGNVTCVEIDCPKDGRELVDDSCVRWEPDLRNFRKEAPFCCPDMVCVQHSYCELDDGFVLQNFEEISHKVIGCDKTCQCLYGNITCHDGNNCSPLSERPPPSLKCPPELITQLPTAEDECCLQWACLNRGNGTTDDTLAGLLLNKSTFIKDNLPTDNTSKTNSQKDQHAQHHHNHPPHHHFPHDNIHTLINTTHNKDTVNSGFLDGEDSDDQIVDPHDYDDEQDQYLPHSPPSGNRPSIVGLDKLTPADLQNILHHLANLGGDSHEHSRHEPPPPPRQQHPSLVPGTYTSVHTPQQVVHLEREAGGRFVGRAEDGSYIVALPEQRPPDHQQQINPHAGSVPGLRPRPGNDVPHSQRPISIAHSPFASHSARPPVDLSGPGHFPQQPPQLPFGIPPHIPHGGHIPNEATKVSNILVQPLNESTMQIDFTVSPILVGLHGHVEVLYTKEFSRKSNPAHWESKIFQQAEDIIDNTHMQLFLTSLEPDTDYHMQIKVVVMAQFTPTSDIILIRTPAPAITTTPSPPEIVVDPELKLAASGSRSIKLQWRKFDEFDTLVDGVQIAYKESGDKVYQTTPMIHRSISEYELTNLKPNKDYEVNLLFIPFHTDQKTVLKSDKSIFIKTDEEEDEYSFDVVLSSGKVTESSIELKVSGVPLPEDKYVNIYQVFYSSDTESEQKSYFKAPKSETTKRATLTELRPGTKYTIWLEAFLSNGKKKRSNVIDVLTKAGELPSPEKSEQETESKPEPPQTSSYYGALVGLAVVAAMSIIGIIALLMILIKKQNQAKAPINDRKSESSYDNPSFKNFDFESNRQS